MTPGSPECIYFFPEVNHRRNAAGRRRVGNRTEGSRHASVGGIPENVVALMQLSRPKSDAEADLSFVFGNLRLEPDGTLLRGNVPIHLAPKELAALRILLEHQGRIVTPAHLKDALWHDVHVTPDSVPRCISSLRARLGDDAEIRTIYKRGYRLDGTVRRTAIPLNARLPRLAIIPFVSRPGAPEHLGSSLAEELATRLTSLHPPLVQILARDSVFILAAKGLSAVDIGQKVYADFALAGTLQTFAEFLRLRVEMIRLSDGIQIWVEDILVPIDHPIELEFELVNRLSYRLGARLPVSSTARVAWAAEAQTDSPAYGTYLLGRFEGHAQDWHRLRGGIELLQKASDLDPSLVAARSELARAYVTSCLYGYESPQVTAAQVRHMAASAPDVRDASQEILPSLAWLAFHFDRDLIRAAHLFSVAEERPQNSWSARLYAMFALSRQRFQEAEEVLRNALITDPYAPWLHIELAWTQHLAGRASESVVSAEHCLEMFPGHQGAELCAAIVLGFNHEPARALRLAHSVAARLPHFHIAAATEAYALAEAGDAGAATEILERLQWISRERYVCTSFAAPAYVALGNHEAALTDLRTAEQSRCPWFFQILADPRLAPLHGNSEFERMRASIKVMESGATQEFEYVV